MGELQTLVGTDWVCTYDGDLTVDVLEGAVEWALKPPDRAPSLESLDWESIARQTLAIYLAATREAINLPRAST